MEMDAVNDELSNEAVNEAWQTIASLPLRLRQDVHFYQHEYRGEKWLIIADQRDECYFRCSISTEQFLRSLNGSQTVEQIFSKIQEAESSKILQKDIVLLVANLKTANLLHDDSDISIDENGRKNQLAGKSSSPWLRPFAIKFSLFNPDHFLQKTAHYLKPLFNRNIFLLWVALVGTALMTALLNWQGLLEHSEARFSDPKNLLWYWLLYPIVKGLHELGHAYSTKIWGGVVHEMGVMLLVFFPVPYVDSSAAHRFSSKNKRLMVSAAGIMVEVFLACVALFIWVNTDSGMVHDMAFDVLIIGGVSTLLFNANPLLKFDGYYIFSEFIEIPNLSNRSNQYIGYLFKYHILKIASVSSPVTAKGEIKWLFMYGICSNIYRLFISLFIAVWVAGKFFIIGLLLAFWALGAQLLYPAGKQLFALIPVARSAHRLKRLAAVTAIFIFLLMMVFLMPVSHSTHVEGIVSLPENAMIRAGTDGIVTRVLLKDGEQVKKGMVILQLENIELATRRDIIIARLDEARARQKDVLLQDRTEADILKSRVLSVEAELKDVEFQLKSLNTVSATDGVVSLSMSNDLPGRFVKRGDVIGYVAKQTQVSAKVVIPQLHIDAVRRDTQKIEVRFKSQPEEIYVAKFLRELPQATDTLPNRSLGSAAGGEVAIDVRDESGVQVMSNIFQLEISLPLIASGHYLGQRVFVRFIHQRESLWSQLLRQFNHFMLQTPFK